MTQTEGPKKVLSKNRVREHLAKKRSECLNDQLPERLAEKRSEGAWRAFISERSNVPLATSAGPTFLLWGCTMHNWGEASQPEETTSHELRSSDWMFHAQALADRLRLEKRLESAEEALNAFAGRLTRLEKLWENSSMLQFVFPSPRSLQNRSMSSRISTWSYRVKRIATSRPFLMPILAPRGTRKRKRLRMLLI